MYNKYLVTILKSVGKKNSWWTYEIESEGIEDAIKEVNSNPTYWGDCDQWEIIAIHKEWAVGGQMVMKVNIGRIA